MVMMQATPLSRAEVESLRRELDEKDALLAKHSENLQRWSAETLSVQRASERL